MYNGGVVALFVGACQNEGKGTAFKVRQMSNGRSAIAAVTTRQCKACTEALLHTAGVQTDGRLGRVIATPYEPPLSIEMTPSERIVDNALRCQHRQWVSKMSNVTRPTVGIS